MARYDPRPTHALYGLPEARVPADDLIRPNLRRAFPLPAETDDGKFQVLLAALAERGPRPDESRSRTT